MKLKLFFVSTGLVLSLSSMAADQTPSTESIKELLKVSNAQKTSEMALAPVVTALNKSLDDLQAKLSAKANSAQLKTIEKRMGEIHKIYPEMINWEKLEPVFTKVYSENLTQEEVNGVTAFFKSSAGKAWLEKTPVLFQKTQEALIPVQQEYQKALQAKAQELVQELQKEK